MSITVNIGIHDKRPADAVHPDRATQQETHDAPAPPAAEQAEELEEPAKRA
jgi:hypothetical protein